MAKQNKRKGRRNKSIERHGTKPPFAYTYQGRPLKDAKVLERIAELAVPPAWRDVEIAASPRAKILAQGFDEAGRRQAIYNPKFRAKQDEQKFDRAVRFAQALPRLRAQVDKDLRRRSLNRERVAACVTHLIDEEFFRVGNTRYAKTNASYGITTLRNKHVKKSKTSVTFDFTGKSGKQHRRQIRDRRILRLLDQLAAVPGHEVFRYLDDDHHAHNLRSSDVNAYLRRAIGSEFSTKDFRTWGASALAIDYLLAVTQNMKPSDEAIFSKSTETAMVKAVAERLGNTPAIARSSYIDPRIIDFLHKKDAVKTLQKLAADYDSSHDLGRSHARDPAARGALSLAEWVTLEILSSHV